MLTTILHCPIVVVVVDVVVLVAVTVGPNVGDFNHEKIHESKIIRRLCFDPSPRGHEQSFVSLIRNEVILCDHMLYCNGLYNLQLI